MAIDPKKLSEFVKGKKGKKGLPEMLKGKYGKGKGPLADWAKEEETEQEHAHDRGGKDIDVDAIGERVQSGKGDKRLMRLASGVTEENNPPSWVEDEDIWEKAKDAVEDKWDEYDEPYAVVAHVYQQMGGGIAEGGGKGGGKGGRHDEPDDNEG
jgi:hypothetical protein